MRRYAALSGRSDHLRYGTPENQPAGRKHQCRRARHEAPDSGIAAVIAGALAVLHAAAISRCSTHRVPSRAASPVSAGF